MTLDAYYKVFALRDGNTDYLPEEDCLLLKNGLKDSIDDNISTQQRRGIKTDNKNISRLTISAAMAIIIIVCGGLLFIFQIIILSKKLISLSRKILPLAETRLY